jgi:hypothetical protein
MSFGDRAALEGVLSQWAPRLSIELGTAQGGSLERLAFHSDEVYTFDLIEPPVDRGDFPNVHFHVGDSHEQLPNVLEELEASGRNVDFILVDGDHSSEGVRADVQALLESPAIGQTIILLHDTMNESVRAGVEQVRFEAYPKVAYVELDFVAGYLFREEGLKHELWGGFGLVVVDAKRLAYFTPPVRQQRYYDAHSLFRMARDLVVLEEQQGENPAALTR